MIGRTHGVHAEPVTFGFKMAVWYSQVQRDLERMRAARDAISVGKISGAVGIFGNIDPKVEEYVCERLGLAAAPVSTQIVQRDRHAQYLATLGDNRVLVRELRHGDAQFAADGNPRGAGDVPARPARVYPQCRTRETRGASRP